MQPIGNVTAAIGKEAVLPCTIRKLGNHKVRDLTKVLWEEKRRGGRSWRSCGTLISQAGSVRINGFVGSRVGELELFTGHEAIKELEIFGNLVATNGSRGCSWQMSAARVFLPFLVPPLFRYSPPTPSPPLLLSSSFFQNNFPTVFRVEKVAPRSFTRWR